MKKYSLLIIALAVAFTAQAQWNSWGKSVRGEGKKVTKTIELDDFTGINVSIGAEVHLRQGKNQKVEIKAQENIIELINREVWGDKWSIRLEKGVNLRNHDGIDVYITLPMIDELGVSGSGSIEGETDFVDVGDLEVHISGSGDISLSGDGQDLEVSVSGSGEIEMADFEVTDCSVSIAGSGDCEVHVSQSLKVSIAGSGDVKYRGDPAKVKSSIAGSGDVRSF